MEQSKLISEIVMKLKTMYPYYFEKMDEMQIASLCKTYQEELSQYNEETITTAIKNIIRNNKYMPSLSEIIEECDKCKTHKANEIVEKMWEDGYFKKGPYGELDDSQAYRNYNKTLKFIEEGIIPEWLRNDMKKYYTQMITNQEPKLLSTTVEIEDYSDEEQKLLEEIQNSLNEM